MAIEFDPLFEKAMEDLPADKELAFAVYVQRAETILEAQRAGLGYAKERLLQRSAANHIVGLMQALDISLPIDVTPPGGDDFDHWFEAFLGNVNYYAVIYRVARKYPLTAGVVTAISFTPDYKEEIDQLLGRMRKIINGADLSEPKKNAIFDKIAALQSEVDRSTTRFDAFLSRWLDLTNAIGEGTENLEPVVKLMERLLKVFGKAKVAHDQAQLPAPEERKQLPSPEAEPADDDVPF